LYFGLVSGNVFSMKKNFQSDPRSSAPVLPEKRLIINWGIIGCGNVTEVKSGPGFSRTSGSALAMVMRRDGRLAEDYAKRHGVPRWTMDANAVIADPGVDAVYVATPVGSHLDYALKVCAAGKPCYMEKPMARNTTEAETMVAAFRKAGVPLFVAYYRRGLPRFLKVRDLVANGAIGKLTGVSYRCASPAYARSGELPWRLKAEDSGGGLFMDIGCHTLDIIDFIAGPLQAVQGSAANVASDHAVEDSVAMTFRLELGGLGTASWNFASAQSEEVIVFSGTAGRITISTFGQEPVRLERGKEIDQFDLPNPTHIQQPLIGTIVNQLLGKGVCPSTGETALRTTRVMDTVLDAYYGGRADAFWARPESWPGRRRQ
jgi:1,5-anhydro-D-fructose reductase (1,5-anhydro-D-mannitol-forming)